MVFRLVLALFFILVAGSSDGARNAEKSRGYYQAFSSYLGLKREVLRLIGGASRGVWIASSRIDDSDIITSLALAKYRQIQVAVLSAQQPERNKLQRLFRLNKEKIPVGTIRSAFFSRFPTFVLVDGYLLVASAPLSIDSRNASFYLRAATPSYQTKPFIKDFKKSFLASAEPLAKQFKSFKYVEVRPKTPQRLDGHSRPYRHGGPMEQAPKDVAKKLPRVLKWQKKSEDRENRRERIDHEENVRLD